MNINDNNPQAMTIVNITKPFVIRLIIIKSDSLNVAIVPFYCGLILT